MRLDRDWADVDGYLVHTLVGADPGLEAALAANARAGLPPIDVAPNQGKLLNLLARMSAARNVLEIGTLGGYSTIWLARAVGPSGRVVSLEREAAHAEVARANIERAGLADRVEVRVGVALDLLPLLAQEGRGSFDLVFIDADKENNSAYVRWALALSHPGTVIVVDNVVRGGAVADPGTSDKRAQASRAVLELIADEPRLDGTALQTVGAKGWDGMAIAIVTE